MPLKKTAKKSPSAKKSPMPQILVVTSPKNSKKNSSSSFLVVSTKSPRKPRAVKSPSKKSSCKKSSSKKSPINMPILGYGKKPNCVTFMLK